MSTTSKDLRECGRDEMNLAEFPIAALSDRVPDGEGTLVFERSDGSSLTVTGSDAYGLPTALDSDVIVALMAVTKQKTNFEDRQVEFTISEVLDLMKMADDGRAYARLRESLLRWLGVTLVYEKSYVERTTTKDGPKDVPNRTKGFHVLESIDLTDGRGQPSTFVWNRTFFANCQLGLIKRLDLAEFFALESSISKRIYRFLDKRFHKKGHLTLDLSEFAFVHVGLTRSYEGKVGKIKEKLRPAFEELVEIGFLAAFPEYEKRGRGVWAIHLRKGKGKGKDQGGGSPGSQEAALVSRGLDPKVASRLVAEYGAERVDLGVAWVDDQCRAKAIKRPAGYLRKAIEEGYAPEPDPNPLAPSPNFDLAKHQERAIDAYRQGLSELERDDLTAAALAGLPAERRAEIEGASGPLKKLMLVGLLNDQVAAIVGAGGAS